MAPEVFFTVCYNMARPPASLANEHSFKAAMLDDYSRRRVSGEDYPGIMPEQAHCVRGTLATGLTETNLYRLDYFEGSEYERITVKVKILKSEILSEGKTENEVEQEVDAFVYIFKNPARLEEREWDYDEFRRDKLRKWSRADFVFEGECIISSFVDDGLIY
jgi:hypothetical protein